MSILRYLLRSLFPSKRRSEPTYHPVDLPYERPKIAAVPSTVATRPSAGPNTIVASVAIVERVKGRCYVVDGDTITIGKDSFRLAGIDAPEMDQPFGKAAKWALFELCKGQVITAELEDHLSYDRNVATCRLPDGRDLSAEMVKLGLALDWHKFSGGKYRHLEPEGVRRKLWRVEAKHKGRLAPVKTG